MKRKELLSLFSTLAKFKDKNRITDSSIRMAVIKNYLAVKPIATKSSAYLADLRKQYDSPESEKIVSSIGELMRRIATTSSPIERKELQAALLSEQKRLDDYFAPVQKEFNQIRQDYENEEVSVTLLTVPLENLDACTEGQVLSTEDISNLSPMLEL